MCFWHFRKKLLFCLHTLRKKSAKKALKEKTLKKSHLKTRILTRYLSGSPHKAGKMLISGLFKIDKIFIVYFSVKKDWKLTVKFKPLHRNVHPLSALYIAAPFVCQCF